MTKDKNEVKADEKIDMNAIEVPGYPLYPAYEDIYNLPKEEIDHVDFSKLDFSSEPDPQLTGYGKNYNNHLAGNNLDVPGSELDDAQEWLGSEDEENNYYSIGGDAHNNLEEDNG